MGSVDISKDEEMKGTDKEGWLHSMTYRQTDRRNQMGGDNGIDRWMMLVFGESRRKTNEDKIDRMMKKKKEEKE